MPEWSNGAVSKTVELLVGSGGSNPPLSAEDEEKKLSSSLEQLFFFIFCKARRRRAGMCDRREQIPPKRGMADKVGMVLPPTKPSPRRRLSRFAPRGQCSGVSAEFFNLPAALPFSLHNGSRFRISLPLWKEQTCSPSESELKTWENCTPSEGGKWRNGRETPLQTLWWTWPGNSPSEGGTISRGNCTPSEGGKWRNGRETPLQTLWRTWPGNSPFEGETI